MRRLFSILSGTFRWSIEICRSVGENPPLPWLNRARKVGRPGLRPFPAEPVHWTGAGTPKTPPYAIRLRRAIIATVCMFLNATTTVACDLALVLAVDVSGSVDRDEYRTQMDGLAAALRDPVVSEALVIAQAELMLVQWTGSTRQQVTIPWTTIDSFTASDTFANRVAADPRVWRNYSTAIGEALGFSLTAFKDVPHCARHLIDLSGDGLSNEGIEPGTVHKALKDAGVIVNAIAIEASEPELTAYFYEHVITGEGAFVVSAASFEEYPARIRKKLLREVTHQTASKQ